MVQHIPRVGAPTPELCNAPILEQRLRRFVGDGPADSRPVLVCAGIATLQGNRRSRRFTAEMRRVQRYIRAAIVRGHTAGAGVGGSVEPA